MTEQEMIQKQQKRKDKVKNIAIIFLTIMLLLTFFSNTIMNFSLAEVGSAYATSGSLTTKIRGDAYVEAKDPKQVTTKLTSEVLKVLVKDGDKVKKGQTMFVLEGEAKKEELKQAQTDLLTMNYEYEKALLEIAVPDYAKNNAEIKYARQDLQSALKEQKKTKKEFKKKEKEYKKLQKTADKKKEAMLAKAEEVADLALVIAQQQAEIDNYESEKALLSGDEVDAATLEDALTAAKRELEDAKAEEEKYTVERTLEAVNADIKAKKQELEDLKSALLEAQDALADAQTELADAKSMSGTNSEIQSLMREVSAAQTELNSKAAEISSKKTQIDNQNKAITAKQEQINNAASAEEKAGYEKELENLQNALKTLNTDLSQLESELSAQNINVSTLQSQLSEARTALAKENSDKITTAQRAVNKQQKAVNTAQQKVGTAQTELAELSTEKTQVEAAEAKLDALKNATAAAQQKVTTAERALEDAQTGQKRGNKKEEKALNAKIKEVKAAKLINDNNKTKLDAEYTEAQEDYNNAKAEVDSYQKADENALETLNQSVEEKQKALENLYVDLAATQKDDNLKQQVSALDSKQKKESIEMKKKEIAELKEKGKDVYVKAESAGVISNVSVKQGDTTTPDTAMAQIALKKNGYQISVPVTNEQSKLVKRGDHASVLNVWDEIDVVLTEIKTDPQNPNAGKTLIFDVSGNVENGTSLSIAVGERTASYDCIVPTSAIREDSDGKFVLVIQEKSSPVGNRYIAKKESVTVLTQDETHSAVTAGFDSYTSIITTASKSVQPGDYVRLAASN